MRTRPLFSLTVFHMAFILSKKAWSGVGATWITQDCLNNWALWKGFDITFLEPYPIVLSSVIWAHQFQNRTKEFHIDNWDLVSVINKCSSPKPHIRCLVRALVLAILRFNFVVYAFHIPGVQNVLADALSRKQIRHFMALHPQPERDPVIIPNIWNQEPHGFYEGSFPKVIISVNLDSVW